MTKNGIRYPDKVDLVAQGNDGTTILVLVETESIRAQDARALQAKLNNYVDFALDGQLVRTYPEAASKPVLIRIDLSVPPDQFITELLRRFRAAALGYGITVEARVDLNQIAL